MAKKLDNSLVRNVFERVVIMTLIAVFIALSVISVANDMYAFVKSDNTIQITLNSPTELTQLSKLLQREGIIKNPTIFVLFIKSKGRQEKLESFVGETTLRQNMSYREIMLALS